MKANKKQDFSPISMVIVLYGGCKLFLTFSG